MALHTSVGFIFASIGMLVIAWNRESQHALGLPRWMPIPTAIAVLTATICFWQALVAEAARIERSSEEMTALSDLATVVLIGGVLLAIAMALAAHLALKARKRAIELADANAKLEATNEIINAEVRDRTAELGRQVKEARILHQSTEIGAQADSSDDAL